MENQAHLNEARRILSGASHPLRLTSPKDALQIYGPSWFAALDKKLAEEFPNTYLGILIDSGDRADLAHEAMRLGLKHLVFAGHPKAAEALQNIARQLGAHLEIRPREPSAD